MDELRNAYEILDGNPQGKILLGNSGVEGNVIFNFFNAK
jgi:hypothetical protein